MCVWIDHLYEPEEGKGEVLLFYIFFFFTEH